MLINGLLLESECFIVFGENVPNEEVVQSYYNQTLILKLHL